VRARLRDWLQIHQWPANRIDELVLAVSEAVSNCVEHGYRTPCDTVEHTNDGSSDNLDRLENTVDVRGHLTVHDDGYSQVVLTVRDQGRWRVPDTRPTTRGRGLALMRGCAEDMDLRHTDHGTTVVLRSRPVPPLPSGT